MCQQVLILVYELSEDSTHVPKHVGVVKDHTFQRVCNLCVKFVWVSGETCQNTLVVGREMGRDRCDCKQKAFGVQVA